MRSETTQKVFFLLLLISGLLSCATLTLEDTAELLKSGELDSVTFDYASLVFNQDPGVEKARLDLLEWTKGIAEQATAAVEERSGYHNVPINICAFSFYEPAAGRAMVIGPGINMAMKSASMEEARSVQVKAAEAVDTFAEQLRAAAVARNPALDLPFYNELSRLVSEDITRDHADFDLANLPTPAAEEFLFQSIWGRVCDTDAKTSEGLKRIVLETGWPDKTVYGDKLDRGTGRILVHSPDIEFQRSMLPKLYRLFDEGRTSGINVARLADVLAKFSGKKLVYGTRYHCGPHGIVFAPVEDPKNLSKRWESLGLDSVERLSANCE